MVDLHQQEPVEDSPPTGAGVSGWKPPKWQLLTEHGVYDYDRKPLNPFTRIAMYLRGYRWRRNPIFAAHRGRGY